MKRDFSTIQRSFLHLLNEWSGAYADLGTLLPLAFALIVFNGFSPMQLFLLWGIVYVAVGWIYRVPVSVQPLKAMSVIAISAGLSTHFLSSTAVFYGIILLALSASGLIRWIQRWFSPALVRGVQLSIGLLLAYKAVQLVWQKGILLNNTEHNILAGLTLLTLLFFALVYFQFQKNIPVIPLLLIASIPITRLLLGTQHWSTISRAPVQFTLPDVHFLAQALVLLIIPQLPLTLGNAIIAANDACHTFWGERARQVSPTRLGLSIGLADIFTGLLGGFPICHGAGGIAAHYQFGAKTGKAPMIIGLTLILLTLVPGLSLWLFYIPVPLLSAMLLFDSGRMIWLVRKLNTRTELAVASLVGVISFFTRNLTMALLAGFFVEKMMGYLFQKQAVVTERRTHD